MDSWEKIIPEFTYNPEVPYFDVLVPTMDTVRYGFLFEKLVSVKHPVLFTGTTGVGKSVITKGCLRQLQEKGKYVGTVMNFSAQTSSLRTQEIIESKLEKKRKTILGGLGRGINQSVTTFSFMWLLHYCIHTYLTMCSYCTHKLYNVHTCMSYFLSVYCAVL